MGQFKRGGSPSFFFLPVKIPLCLPFIKGDAWFPPFVKGDTGGFDGRGNYRKGDTGGFLWWSQLEAKRLCYND